MSVADFWARQLELAWANGDQPSFSLIARAMNAGVDIRELEHNFFKLHEDLNQDNFENEYDD